MSAKADVIITQLQEEIFNHSRKEVTIQGVVETLLKSETKAHSHKSYAASWKTLIKGIKEAVKGSEVGGQKPPNFSTNEWALILSHPKRKRSTTGTRNKEAEGEPIPTRPSKGRLLPQRPLQDSQFA